MQARIDQVEHEIKDIQQKKEDEENEIEGTGSGSNGEEDDDKYDQTYEEKVRNQLCNCRRVSVIFASRLIWLPESELIKPQMRTTG